MTTSPYLTGMKQLPFFLCMLLLATVHGQDGKPCDTIYRWVDQDARYTGGAPALVRYVSRELAPLIFACYNEDSTKLISRLTMLLMIDANGQVRQVDFEEMELTDRCSARLRKGLLSMKGWEPAKRKGVSVCSYYRWVIPCLLWQEEE